MADLAPASSIKVYFNCSAALRFFDDNDDPLKFVQNF